MARISSYVNNTPVVAADKWIGSDSVNKQQTKNFTAQLVADFINSFGADAQNLRYKYNRSEDYQTGCISFEDGGNETVPLNGITSMNLGVFQLRSTYVGVSNFITGALVGSDILLTECNDVKNWAIYTLESAVLRDNELEYEVSLKFKTGGGVLKEDDEYFISLLRFDSAREGDANKVANLNGESLVYVINHDLNKFPSVSIIQSSTGNQIFGDVKYNTENQCTLTFTSLVTGTVTFN